jgi:hypothetical protein
VAYSNEQPFSKSLSATQLYLMEVFMTKTLLSFSILLLFVTSLSFSQITQLWESPSGSSGSIVYQIGSTNKLPYLYTLDFSAKTVTLYDINTLSQAFSISNPDTSYLYNVIPDVNGNGYPDVIMYKSSKNVTIRDLKTGSIIYTYTAPTGGTCQPYAVGTTSGSNVLKLVIWKNNANYTGLTFVVISLGVAAPASVSAIPNDMPATLTLEQNYPNPFNPSTVIRYSINNPENVQITIYNSAGQSVRELVSSAQIIGEHSITWDGRDNFGMSLSSGVYFYQIRAGNDLQARKMVLLK